MNEVERRCLAEIVQRLEALGDWLARINPDHADDYAPPVPGSALRGDDQATDPYQVSHAVWNSLSHAVDHLHCLRSLVTEARIVHMYAPYTVLRAALENASTAVWLLSPQSRSERVLRRLQLAATDIRNADSVQKVMGTTPRWAVEDRLDGSRALALARGLDPKRASKKIQWGDVVDDAGYSLSDTSLPFVIWKACSGIAHGDFWATISVTDRTEIGGDARVTRQRIAAKMEMLRDATKVTTDMTREGWALYDRCSASYWPTVR